MKTRKYLLVFGISLVCALSYAQDNEVILSVGEDQISLAEFKSIFYKNNHNDTLITKEYLDDYMQLFVNFRLKVKEAKQLKYDTIPEFISELAMYRNQLAKPYLSDNQFDEKLINEAYERMQTDVKASHILISVSEKAIPADTLKAYTKAIDIRNKIHKGMDFVQAAEQFSDDKSAVANGGDLGFFTVFMMVYPFESAAYNTKVEEVSKPVRTKYGYHLIKVNERRKARGEVKAAHIMFKVAKGATEEVINTSKLKIDDIVNKLNNGENFSQLAEKFSEDRATAVKGGNLPWFGVGKMVKEFEDAAFTLQEIGEVSTPFKTDFGWHVVKLLEKREIPKLEDIKEDLKRKVKQDSRNNLRDKAIVSKIKKENNFKQYSSRLNEIAKFIDESLENGEWKSEKVATLKRNLFVLDGNYYSQADFIQYILENQMKVSDDYQTYFNSLYQSFVNESCIDYEKSRLEEKYPEFKALLQEYTDGILLFDLMDDMVWTKAIKDTLGLQDFFDSNNENYMWGERVNAKVYTCIDETIAKKTLRYIKRGHKLSYVNDEYILEKINRDSPLNLQITANKYSRDENVYVSQTNWDVGVSDLIKGKDGSIIIVDILSVIHPIKKELSETKGKAISDYQDYLEKNWLDELRAKYPVTINKKVLYSLTQ